MKKNKWVKPRHYMVRALLSPAFRFYTVLKYGVKIEKYEEDKPRQYLVLYNHQTAFDQFFIGLAIKTPVYYLASEDLFSNGFVSKLIKYLVAPIPIKKQATDITAVKNCIRVAKEGGTIAIAPEGNRTFSGKTEYMNPSIASLAKKLGLPIMLFHIEGGYGVHPRWSDVVRKGKMRAFVSKVIEPKEYADLSGEELAKLIEEGLFINEANSENIFKHKKRAEYLERAMYVCPYCGLSSFESNNDIIKCEKCGKEISYGVNTELKGVGFEFPFKYVNDWYEAQKDFINELELTPYIKNAMYKEKTNLSEVILYKRKNPLRKNSNIFLYGDRIVIDEGKDELVFNFDDITAISVLGRNKLNIYCGGKIYQIKSEKRFNALKYVHIYNRYNNVKRGVAGGKFLGL